MQRSQYNDPGFRARQDDATYRRIAKGLGWFSIGLGLAEVAAPGFVANLVGIRDDKRNKALTRSPLYGMRELAAGAGILTQSQPAPWLWSRVAGDILDLSTLAAAMRSDHNDRKKLGMGIGAVAGVMVLDVICAQKLSRSESGSAKKRSSRHSVRSILIDKSPEELYGFWHNFENLPKFMKHLESVRSTGSGRTRWAARGPANRRVEWEAEVTEDQPNRLIAWQSVEGSAVRNSGKVTFERGPGGVGTIVRVELSYDPPGGAATAALAKLFGKDAGQLVGDSLRGFKQIMETGEIVHSDASIHRTMHPARPAEANESTLTHRPGQPAADAEARVSPPGEIRGTETREKEYA